MTIEGEKIQKKSYKNINMKYKLREINLNLTDASYT